MGKDGDRRGSQKSGPTKEDLKTEHLQLVKREKELSNQYQEIKTIFQKLDQGYQASKATFSVQRYGQLKDMIKQATSEATMRTIQQTIQTSSQTGDSGKSGLAGLLSKAKEFSGDAQQQQGGEEAAATGKSSKTMSSFVKKFKNLTGFSDEPIADEDVMSESELQRDNVRKQRAIQHHINELTRALKKLEKLKHHYETSKAHAPPKRYQELKDMIKVAVEDKFS